MRKTAMGNRLVFGYLGIFLMFEGFVTAVPLAMLAFYPSEYKAVWDFAIPAAFGVLLGLVLFLSCIAGRPKGHFARHDDALLLVLLWISAVILGAVPFYLTKFPALNFGDADMNLDMSVSACFFESMSGYSATGLTVLPEKAYLSGVDSSLYSAAHVFLFHRAFMQFIGGIGLVLIVAGAISDRYNLKLYFAEGHNDKLMPNLGKSAKLIFGIYFGYIAVGALSLWLAGMTPFDAICHSTAALATGGFSTRYASIVYYQDSSVYPGNGIFPNNVIAIEIILMVLMLLGATNFVLHTFLLRGKWKQFIKDIEVRLSFWLLVIFTLMTTFSTLYLYDGGKGIALGMSFRYSIFNVVSSMTTTGFVNYQSAPFLLGEVALFSGILLMAVGGGLGSTSGGIKGYRFGLLLKDFYYSIRYRFSSSRMINPNPVYRLGELKEEDDESSMEAHNYTLLYLLFFLSGAMVLLFLPGVGVQEGTYEFMSALSGTGITVIDYFAYEKAYPSAYPWLLWILSTGMFFGRLEILPVHFAFVRVVVDPIKKLLSRPHRAKKEA
jgi:trk system potassium uptake protein TrkH